MEPTNRNQKNKGSMPVPSLNEGEVLQSEMPEEIPASPVELISSKVPEPSSIKQVPMVPKKGIAVIALRSGFFAQMRKIEGDEFFVPDMNKVGDWMRCVDPSMEKQHLALQKERKQKAGI